MDDQIDQHIYATRRRALEARVGGGAAGHDTRYRCCAAHAG